MKTYIADFIPRIQRFSLKLDNLTILTNQHWVEINNSEEKVVYIFRKNNELLISSNGKIEKAKWEYLGNDYLLIENVEGSYLFKHGFLDEYILALKIDSKDEYLLFVNETKYNLDVNSFDKLNLFLKKRYKDSFGINREYHSNNCSIDNSDVVKYNVEFMEDTWGFQIGKMKKYKVIYENGFVSTFIVRLKDNTYSYNFNDFYDTLNECIFKLYEKIKNG